ncbi:probable glycerol-3-phosphate acyltransferase 2 [Beta vulgaris subsp. vulgaris]|uniref:probable glycerol-3-phosphate acyltransferase 2 n=1 Tax=Beta vulgaris subsp. vulgaris TaxID=3555 RepID=UPI0020369201|nr:probable glycerol-3-phosphate acyltransferase 2 [Beta vulgaris subsp. vulgaris]
MQQKYHKYASLTKLDDQVLQNKTLVFNVEETLLKSFSMFSYFMLVAFEGGGPLRALILLFLYPFMCILKEEMRLKSMVFICFFGIKKTKFSIGTTVLPKFFLENVGDESFEVVMRFGRKVGVTNLPRIMVEGFLNDYLGVEDIVGREINVVGGYYTGLLDVVVNDEQETTFAHIMSQSEKVGISCNNKCCQTPHDPFNYCKDIYVVSKDDKERWNNLPRDKYPKPLLFHDGRLAFMPTPINTLVMFIWLPFGFILSISRVFITILLPYQLSTPILAFSGLRYPSSMPLSSKHIYMQNTTTSSTNKNSKGMIYVCNHKTVLDSIYISYICRMNSTVLSYGISKLSAFLCPVYTIALTRNREKDAAIMHKVLSQGRNIVICPEGTTCREPYLLRFSPLFAQISDDIIPVAIQLNVSMFYGTTASGIKAFDPFCLMMNPWPSYYVQFLEKLPKAWTCGSGGRTKFEVANYVQDVIGKALGYKCTALTRKDKYLMLVGNSGVVN